MIPMALRSVVCISPCMVHQFFHGAVTLTTCVNRGAWRHRGFLPAPLPNLSLVPRPRQRVPSLGGKSPGLLLITHRGCWLRGSHHIMSALTPHLTRQDIIRTVCIVDKDTAERYEALVDVCATETGKMGDTDRRWPVTAYSV